MDFVIVSDDRRRATSGRPAGHLLEGRLSELTAALLAGRTVLIPTSGDYLANKAAGSKLHMGPAQSLARRGLRVRTAWDTDGIVAWAERG